MHAATGLAAAATAQQLSAPLAMGLAGMAALASQQARAANVSSYKALVCLGACTRAARLPWWPTWARCDRPVTLAEAKAG